MLTSTTEGPLLCSVFRSVTFVFSPAFSVAGGLTSPWLAIFTSATTSCEMSSLVMVQVAF
jgi:hypothetical protein